VGNLKKNESLALGRREKNVFVKAIQLFSGEAGGFGVGGREEWGMV